VHNQTTTIRGGRRRRKHRSVIYGPLHKRPLGPQLVFIGGGRGGRGAMVEDIEVGVGPYYFLAGGAPTILQQGAGPA
jgi:hypothetical protein